MATQMDADAIRKEIKAELYNSLVQQYEINDEAAYNICEAFFDSGIIEVTPPELYSPKSEFICFNYEKQKIISMKPGNIIVRFYHGSDSSIEKALLFADALPHAYAAWKTITADAPTDVTFSLIIPCLLSILHLSTVELPVESISIISYLYKRNITCEDNAIRLDELYKIFCKSNTMTDSQDTRVKFDNMIGTLLEFKTIDNSYDGNKIWLTEEIMAEWQ